MRIACISYREWALEIYDEISRRTNHTVLIIRNKEQYDDGVLLDFKPDLALFYGWSWKVSANVIEKIKCIMLHPSHLPKYRGGSPIQNQIIAGETHSAVTLFLMNDEMDAGDIIAQEQFSLGGHLKEILHRITKTGLKLTLQILDQGYTPTPQDHSQATFCSRRKLEESELTLDELKNYDSHYLFNKIRMLEDPYPNAFIQTLDGKRLIIKRAELDS